MIARDGRTELTALYVIGENPAQSDADMHHVEHILEQLDHLVVQEIFLTKTAQMAARRASRRQRRGPKARARSRTASDACSAVERPSSHPAKRATRSGSCRELAARLGVDWGHPTAEDVWNEVRALSPQLAGMSYARLEALDGIQWPCPDESHPGTQVPSRATLGRRSGEARPARAVLRRPPRRSGRAAGR